MTSTTPAPIDLDNIQGDILSGLPKKTQIYVFFQIIDVNKFRSDLTKFIPHIKTVSEVLKDRKAIDDHKKKGHRELLRLVGVNIAFSHLGFVEMGIDDSSLGKDEDPFRDGQKTDAVKSLSDPIIQTATGNEPNWDPAFLQPIHGVIIIAGDSDGSINKKKKEVEQVFGVHHSHAAIKEVSVLKGDVRPGDQAGHEHFGFKDGISNPTIIGFDDKNANPGPAPVQPGVLLTGHESDVDIALRKPWSTDGSFLVFRYLFQQVPEFDNFLKKNPITMDGLTPEEGSELLGARFVGRWKSGAPIDITPFKDDKELGADATRNNNFNFNGELNSQFKCPYAAHNRRTNPRKDLPSEDANRIMRRGVQFGPEVTDEERKKARTLHDRGLLFACYQSSIVKGFQFLQESWANRKDFPPPQVGRTNPEVPGLDALIGQGAREMTGTDPNHTDKEISMPTFIIPRGGEYFFSPSLKGLKETLAVTPASGS